MQHYHIKEPKMLSLDAFSTAQMHLAAELRPDRLRELERSPTHASHNRGGVLLLSGSEGRGGEGRMKGREKGGGRKRKGRRG